MIRRHKKTALIFYVSNGSKRTQMSWIYKINTPKKQRILSTINLIHCNIFIISKTCTYHERVLTSYIFGHFNNYCFSKIFEVYHNLRKWTHSYIKYKHLKIHEWPNHSLPTNQHPNKHRKFFSTSIKHWTLKKPNIFFVHCYSYQILKSIIHHLYQL